MAQTDMPGRNRLIMGLEAMQFYNATELKGVQSKLTASATQLDKLTTGPLRCLLAQDEEEVIRRAADLVRQLNLRVEHAKEIKKREEKRKADETKKRSVAVLKVLKDNFEIEQNEGEEFHRRLVSEAEISLTLSKDQQFLVYLPTTELAEEMLVTLQRYSRGKATRCLDLPSTCNATSSAVWKTPSFG